MLSKKIWILSFCLCIFNSNLISSSESNSNTDNASSNQTDKNPLDEDDFVTKQIGKVFNRECIEEVSLVPDFKHFRVLCGLTPCMQANYLQSYHKNKENDKILNAENFKLNAAKCQQEYVEILGKNIGNKMKTVRNSPNCVIATGHAIKVPYSIEEYLTSNALASQSYAKFLAFLGEFTLRRQRFYLKSKEDMEKLLIDEETGLYKFEKQEMDDLIANYTEFAKGLEKENSQFAENLEKNLFDNVSNDKSCKFNPEEYCFMSDEKMAELRKDQSEENYTKIKSTFEHAMDRLQENPNRGKVQEVCKVLSKWSDQSEEPANTMRFLHEGHDHDEEAEGSESHEHVHVQAVDIKDLPDFRAERIENLPTSFKGMNQKCYNKIVHNCIKSSLFDILDQYRKNTQSVKTACEDVGDEDLKTGCLVEIVTYYLNGNGFEINEDRLNNLYTDQQQKPARRILANVASKIVMDNDDEVLDNKSEKLNDQNLRLNRTAIQIDGSNPDTLADMKLRVVQTEKAAIEEFGSWGHFLKFSLFGFSSLLLILW